MSLNSTLLTKLAKWRGNSELFVRECLGAVPTDQQIEGLHAYDRRKELGKNKLSIRSGHGTGKDAFISWVGIHFLVCYPYSKVFCTAPTTRQLYDILWAELSKWIRQSSLRDELIITKDQIYLKEAGRTEWWIRHATATVKSSKDEQAETLQGLHADNLLILGDEASGIPDPVFRPLEGALTGQNNFAILTGNPTRSSGYFYDTHMNPVDRKHWITLHWSSEDSSIVSKQWLNYYAEKYGKASSVYQVRVLGEFPIEQPGILIPLEWALQCVGNDIGSVEHEPVYLSIDVARFGDNKTVLLPRQGNKILPWKSLTGINIPDVVNMANGFATDLEAKGIVIDETGVGGGVVDGLIKHRQFDPQCVVYGVNAASGSTQPHRFNRIRDELWWKTREKCQKAQYSFPENELGRDLAAELSTLKYDYHPSTDVIKVESKANLRSRLPDSAIDLDTADALAISEFFYDSSLEVFGDPTKEKVRKRSYTTSKFGQPSQQGWLIS